MYNTIFKSENMIYVQPFFIDNLPGLLDKNENVCLLFRQHNSYLGKK